VALCDWPEAQGSVIISGLPWAAGWINDALMRTPLLSMVALSILAFALSACSKPLEERIIGKWQEDNSPNTMEFFPDNTLLLTANGQEIGGTWLKVGDQRLKVEMSVFGMPMGTTVMEITKLSGDKLEVQRNGEVGKFTRAK